MTSLYHLRNSLVLLCALVGTVVGLGHSNNEFSFGSNGALPPSLQGNSNKQSPKEPITLEDVLGGTLSARGFSGQWVPDDDDLIQMIEGDLIVRYNVITGDRTTFANITEIRTNFADAGLEDYAGITFSNDGNFALIEHERSSVWRYSSVAKYHIYDMTTKIFTKLQPEGTPDNEQPELQLVKWSPNGNGIAFVYGYNIYYRANASQATVVKRITTDGSEAGAIYNGIADWVYEEEMFAGPTALWISPNGENLAFVRFNNSEVPTFKWPIYGDPESNKSYPDYREIRYPKAGENNPTADVKVVSLIGNEAPQSVTYNETLQDGHLIGTVRWASNSKLFVATLNRVQTSALFHLCNASDQKCVKIYDYTLAHGWVDIDVPTVSLREGDEFPEFVFIRSNLQQNFSRSYKHIVLIKKDFTTMILTFGPWSAESILGYNSEDHRIYFTTSYWNDSISDVTETHVYSVRDDSEHDPLIFMTNELRNSNGAKCRDNSVSISPKYTKFIHRCGGPDVPETVVRNLTESFEPITQEGPTFVDNAALREALSKKAVPTTKEYTVEVGEGNNKFEARARLYFPADFDESKSYPLLISVYGGPGSQNLGQGYGISWETSLVSSKNIIFGYIDGRGTKKQSTDHLFTLHRNLGTVEIEDQITVGKWLVENVKGIDANRTSIWGWSYGGYATAKVMQKDTGDVYKCGISVAPVTSWLYYDTIYTERYMGLPTEGDNGKAYYDSAVIHDVENFRKKQFMLVHGNADDNVHYQQSMVLARALEQNDVFFHQLSYPDENHSIGSVRRHLYHSLERFLFDECFKTSSPADPNPGDDDSAAASLSKPINVAAISLLYVVYRIVFEV